MRSWLPPPPGYVRGRWVGRTFVLNDQLVTKRDFSNFPPFLIGLDFNPKQMPLSNPISIKMWPLNRSINGRWTFSIKSRPAMNEMSLLCVWVSIRLMDMTVLKCSVVAILSRPWSFLLILIKETQRTRSDIETGGPNGVHSQSLCDLSKIHQRLVDAAHLAKLLVISLRGR